MKKYIKGICGGIIGGIVGVIPWVFMYVYGGMILSLLAMFVAFAIDFGYRKLGGPITKKLPMIITILSILIVVIATLVVIPLLLLKKEEYLVNFSNFAILYQNPEFVGAMVKDCIFSVVFTFLGIAGVVAKTKQEVGIAPKVSKADVKYQENVDAMRTLFQEKNAMDATNAVSKIDLNLNPEQEAAFKSLRSTQTIQVVKDKYYFNTSGIGKRVSTVRWIVLIIILALFFAISSFI